MWPLVGEFIEAACMKFGEPLTSDLRDDLDTGAALLWAAWDGEAFKAAATTMLVPQQTGDLVCHITTCGGTDREQWIDLMAGIEDWARQEGCGAVRITGRKGWARALRGYRPERVVLAKAL